MEEIFKVLLAIILEQQDYFVCPYVPTVEQILCTSVPLISVLEREFQITFSWELVKWNRLFYALVTTSVPVSPAVGSQVRQAVWCHPLNDVWLPQSSSYRTRDCRAGKRWSLTAWSKRNPVICNGLNWYNTWIKPRFYPYPTTHELRLAKGYEETFSLPGNAVPVFLVRKLPSFWHGQMTFSSSLSPAQISTRWLTPVCHLREGRRTVTRREKVAFNS